MSTHEQEAYEHESLARSREEWDATMEAICATAREPQERSTIEVLELTRSDVDALLETLTAFREKLPEDSEPLEAWVPGVWEELNRSLEAEELAALDYEDFPAWMDVRIDAQLSAWEAERA
ncbi:hypothetical protein [Nesterenkonia sandarakina]|uniref:Uncharacterized protein n=1 Tax=Nesterenkonia sandarakina TaxID=272918 RepID=A0A2T0YSU8_9MICC|nr:hypothetical protein [Nesterenkonia sandarakina]PRZ18695.1 hypothetical protein BCL67_1011 [Nesterenkonia sandarakina]